MDTITLTTDFGTSDYYAAMLKGEILQYASHCKIIDITHNISRHDIMEAAFFIRGLYHRFPKQTLHLVAVNTFYAASNELILFEHQGFYFLGPNNGIFSLVIPDLDLRKIREVPITSREDIYHSLAKVVAQIYKGTLLNEIGLPISNFERRLALQAVINEDHVRATIVHVDTFGNVVVNLDKQTFERVRSGRRYSIYYKSDDPITKLSHRYNEVPIGEVCAFFNDIDMLEIAINMGNAHELLSLNKNETIQIDFE